MQHLDLEWGGTYNILATFSKGKRMFKFTKKK